MEYLAKKMIEKQRKYLSRKKKVNVSLKLQDKNIRIIVERSNKYVKAQAVDRLGKVITSVSDKSTLGGTKVENAKNAGISMAKKLLELNADDVVFDRNGYLYHGRVASFAEGLREGGLKI